MARIEKTVFISYRRKDVSWALAVYQDLTHRGYDVFFDYTNIASGDFEQIILSNIKARAHFVLILTPTALDRCGEPGDWLRREIELAIDEKRNIIPLFFDGFNFGNVSEKLTGKLQKFSSYNGMNVHQDYFLEAMERLRNKFLNVPLDAVLHPVSAEVQEVVLEEQRAANKAAKEAKAKAKREAIEARKKKQKEFINGISKLISSNVRRFSIGGITLIGVLGILFAGNYIFNNLPVSETPEFTPSATLKPETPTVTATLKSMPIKTSTPPAPTLGIGSTLVSEKDGMVSVYVPEGEFTMGSSTNDEKPIHQVYLDAYWLDQTEVTNSMYQKCVEANQCTPPSKISSHINGSYYGNPKFDNYPVIYISWHDADNYCTYVKRRLPTEAEWEKAARGTNGNIYPWGNEFDGEKLNSCDSNCEFVWANRSFNDGYADVSPVGNYPAGESVYGVLDIAGNVWEWVNDWYDENYYQNSPSSNPQGPNSGRFKVLRGGSWYDFNLFVSTTFRGRTSYILANYVNSSYRDGYSPSAMDKYIGFRCASSP